MNIYVRRVIVRAPSVSVLGIGQYSAYQQCLEAAVSSSNSSASALSSKNSAQTAAAEAIAAAAAVPNVGTEPGDVPSNEAAAATYAPLSHVGDTDNPHGVTAAQAGALSVSVGEAKGDLVAFSAVGTPARMPVGDNGQMLVADSSEACGLKYVTPSAGAWTAFEALPTRTDDATFAVTDNTDNQGIFVAGRPIRFRANSSSSWVYAMVTAYTSGAVTVSGAPYTATIGADSGREMHYGDMTRLVQETFALAGRFASVATTQALRDMLLLDYVWTRGAAHCVGFRARPLVDDSGASQPHVNVSCAGSLVGTANSNAGLAVSDAAWTITTTDIDPANAAIAFGQTLEVAIDAAGTNDDARDLTLIVNFVLE